MIGSTPEGDLKAEIGEVEGAGHTLSGFENLTISAKDGRPIWRQIYDHALGLIENGRLKPGGQLPGEVHLAEQLGITRATLRRALQQLQQEGHLMARKGVGVFVRSAPSAFLVRDGSRFSDSLKADGKKLVTVTPVLGVEPADEEIAAALRIAPGTPVIRLVRVRAADGQAIYVNLKLFPADLLPDFEPVYARRQSVTDVFVAHGIQKYRRVETEVSGGFASMEEAGALDLVAGTPVLRTSALHEDGRGHRIEWTRGCWLLTSVKFVF